jgi:hypothetical protein
VGEHKFQLLWIADKNIFLAELKSKAFLKNNSVGTWILNLHANAQKAFSHINKFEFSLLFGLVLTCDERCLLLGEEGRA